MLGKPQGVKDGPVGLVSFCPFKQMTPEVGFGRKLYQQFMQVQYVPKPFV